MERGAGYAAAVRRYNGDCVNLITAGAFLPRAEVCKLDVVLWIIDA